MGERFCKFVLLCLPTLKRVNSLDYVSRGLALLQPSQTQQEISKRSSGCNFKQDSIIYSKSQFTDIIL